MEHFRFNFLRQYVAYSLLLGFLCYPSEAQQVTVYSDRDYQGNSKQVNIQRCQNILDFNDQTSSIRTSGCVILYEDSCCQGRTFEVRGDTTLLSEFNDATTSLSPCGSYRAPLPTSIKETWLGHGETMRKAGEDGDIAIYYNNNVKGTALRSHQDYLKRLWQYVKATYGNFGPEGGRLNAFLHANVQGPTYGFNSINNYFDISSDCRNLIDLVSPSPDGWSRDLTGLELDVLTHEVSHIVEGASKGVHGSPSYNLWGDSKWAEIFIYDAYSALGLTGERDRWFQQMQSSQDNYPRPNTFWFRDWFYPLYKQYGVQMLNNYFNLLRDYFPRKSNVRWEYDGRSINLGEFVHFFSGSVKKDLKEQGKKAFKWDDAAEREWQQARRDFSQIRY